MLLACDKSAGAVTGVAYELIFGIKSRRVVRGFFRQPAVALSEQVLMQEFVGRDIGFAHRGVAFALGRWFHLATYATLS